MVIAGCIVIITVVLVRDHTAPATPAPLIGRTPSPIKIFDEGKMEIGISDVLNNDYKLKAYDVHCPSNQPVHLGLAFTCQVTVDGAHKSVLITVKSDDGHYEVGQPQ